MTRQLRRLAIAGFTALVLAMSSAPTADAGMYPYGWGWGWGGNYSTYYGPSWGGYYSSNYSPYYTSYYSPGYDYYSWGSYGCCGHSPCSSCCDPCGGCSSCAGGDCAANGGPLKPSPDGKASGPSKTFGNGSQDKDWKGTKPPVPGTNPGDQRDYSPDKPAEGGSAQRQEAQKPAVPVPQRKEGAASPPDQQPDKPDTKLDATKPAGNTGNDTGPQLNRPDVARRAIRPLSGLDRKVTSVSTPERVRSQFRWRLAGEQIARKTIDPLKSNEGIAVVKLVSK